MKSENKILLEAIQGGLNEVLSFLKIDEEDTKGKARDAFSKGFSRVYTLYLQNMTNKLKQKYETLSNKSSN